MIRFLAALAALFLPGAALAKAALCDQAAATAAREAGVPVEVLRALTRTETGRRMDGALRPWPWTVNMEGEGRWFDDRAEALAFVERRRRAGARSFDIGCFQINHLWHGRHFASVEAMFDPLTNARYAARFLNEIRAEGAGPRTDWVRIAGAYHSRTPRYAEKYRRRFAEILARAETAPPPAVATAAAARAPAAAPLFGPRASSLASPLSAAGRTAAGAALGGVALSALPRAGGLIALPTPPGG